MVLVGVIMGSKSDSHLMQSTLDTLHQMGIEHEVSVMSAHRTPDRVREYAQTAAQRGIEIIIAGAGAAAHLPGVIASWTTLPVIGVPLPTSELRGIDALYSIAQMPSGVPVACMAVGSSGAKNAAFFAAEILALKHEAIKKSLENYRKQQTAV